MMYLVDDVPYNAPAIDGYDPTDPESRVRRTTRAVYEAWRSWAEDRGNSTLRWESGPRNTLFAMIRSFRDELVWQPFPNRAWSRPDQIVGYEGGAFTYGPKPDAQVEDERRLQAMLQALAEGLLGLAP